MKIDPDKQAVQMIFSRKRTKPDHPQIFFNDTAPKTHTSWADIRLRADVCTSHSRSDNKS